VAAEDELCALRKELAACKGAQEQLEAASQLIQDTNELCKHKVSFSVLR